MSDKVKDAVSFPSSSNWSNSRKWGVSIFIGVVAALVFSKTAYCITNAAFGGISGLKTTSGAGPTLIGLLLHATVFALLIRLMLY